MIRITDLNWGFLEVLFLIITFAAGFLATYLVLPKIIDFMKKKGYVGYDIHKNSRPETAESGGLSLLIGISVACVLLMIFFFNFFNEILIFLLTVLSAGAIGFIDDRVRLRSRYKMALTSFAGGFIFLANYFGFIHISSPTIPILGKLRLEILYPLVVPLIVAVFANTTNMLEGYNGEGSGTCLIAVVFIFICALIWNSALGVIFCVITASVLLPFWLFNKYPAKIFPGDIGTLSMGAMIACIALFGSLEAAVFCAMLIHIFNSFYVISSVRGFFESSEIQEEKNDIILLEDNRIKASDKKDAALTLPRLILAKGPLSEPELVKNFYLISIGCGFFSLLTMLCIVWTVGLLDTMIFIVLICIFIIPIIVLLYFFPKIRGVMILMILLLSAGIIFMIFLDLVIMPIKFSNLRILMFHIPVNLMIAFLIAAPGLLVWYFITIKYFWWQIDIMKKQELS